MILRRRPYIHRQFTRKEPAAVQRQLTITRLRSAAGGRARLRRRAGDSLPHHIIARHRHNILTVDQLNLEIHQCLLAKSHSGTRQVNSHHPHEACIIKPLNLFTVRKESLAPRLECFGVVQAQNLDVGDQKSGALDRGQDFRQSRDIAAGENILGDPGVGVARPSERPIECNSITPSSVRSSAQRRKKASY